MKQNSRIILVFNSNHQVLEAEDLLDELDFSFKLIQVPKEVNPNCGLALSFAENEQKAIVLALQKANIPIRNTYLRQGIKFTTLS